MTPYYDEAGITIYHADAFEIVSGWAAQDTQDSLFDLTILDPPYNVGIDYDGYSDRLEAADYWRFIDTLLLWAASSSKSLCYFPGKVNLEESFRALRDATWEPKRLLAWHKREFAGDLWGGGPAMCWEPVHWAVRGSGTHHFNPIYGHQGRDFLIVPSTHGKQYGHPCPKPVEVMRWLVALFMPPYGRLLDLCAGIGTSLVVAKYFGCRAVGVETSERYCEIAAKRLGQEVLAL